MPTAAEATRNILDTLQSQKTCPDCTNLRKELKRATAALPS